MKKNILKLVFASVSALVAGYSVYASQQKVEMSDLALANVEALASGEDSSQDCEIIVIIVQVGIVLYHGDLV